MRARRPWLGPLLALVLASSASGQFDVLSWSFHPGTNPGGAGTVGADTMFLKGPDGSLIISVLRTGKGFVPKADTVIDAGDEVLLDLDPGLEARLTAQFSGAGCAAGAAARRGPPLSRPRCAG